MDKKINDSVRCLETVARKLYEDGVMSLTEYDQVKGGLVKLKGVLLGADISYDAKRDMAKRMNRA